MKRVRKLTTGNVIVMGRKTWESIPEKFRPLPNRTNVVITSNLGYAVPENVEVYDSIEKAIKKHKNKEIFGFGGAAIYMEMIKIADTLYITHVDEEILECDAFFPEISPEWKKVKSEKNGNFEFAEYKRY